MRLALPCAFRTLGASLVVDCCHSSGSFLLVPIIILWVLTSASRLVEWHESGHNQDPFLRAAPSCGTSPRLVMITRYWSSRSAITVNMIGRTLSNIAAQSCNLNRPSARESALRPKVEMEVGSVTRLVTRESSNLSSISNFSTLSSKESALASLGNINDNINNNIKMIKGTNSASSVVGLVRGLTHPCFSWLALPY